MMLSGICTHSMQSGCERNTYLENRDQYTCFGTQHDRYLHSLKLRNVLSVLKCCDSPQITVTKITEIYNKHTIFFFSSIIN